MLAHYGEEPVVYYIGPLAVDGLMIMATAALMAGGRAARASATARTETVTHPTTVAPVSVPVVPAPVDAVKAPEPVRPPVAAPPPAARPAEPVPALAPAQASSTPSVKPTPVVATPARSTTDIPVTASDPGRASSQLAPGLVARGRYIAEAHRKATGNEIGAGELAVKLRVSTARAKQVLAALATTTEPATAVNGNRPTAAVPG
jgi:hypothetical protein